MSLRIRGASVAVDPVTRVVKGWNMNLLAALANSSSQLVRIALVGDSLTQGMYASSLKTTSWGALLTSALQTIYGDGGSGFWIPSNTNTWLTAAGANATAITHYQGNGDIVTPAGTWTQFNSAQNGFGMAIRTTDNTTPGSVTVTGVRGSSINVYTLGNGGANATGRIDVDGGSGSGGQTVNITDTATGLSLIKTNIPGVSAGTHTVKLTYTDAGTKTLYCAGVEGRNTTGVVVDNFGVFSEVASTPGGLTAFGDSTTMADWLGGAQHPADAIIYNLAANDVAAGTTGDTIFRYLRTTLSRARDSGPQVGGTPTVNANTVGAPSTMIVLPHIGAFEKSPATTPVYQDYVSRVIAFAPVMNACTVNFWADGRGSWNYWNSLGYWAAPANPGAAGTDGIHLSDAAQTHVASTIQTALLAPA